MAIKKVTKKLASEKKTTETGIVKLSENAVVDATVMQKKINEIIDSINA
uniref:Uncharacterized protein n=1 Tax=viral metagenome TaxID=1070528 RepID=A0A6M3XPM4_9ZZZZ